MPKAVTSQLQRCSISPSPMVLGRPSRPWHASGVTMQPPCCVALSMFMVACNSASESAAVSSDTISRRTHGLRLQPPPKL
eukprot:6640075-Alexandrium_andersonii.AAC.1